MEVAILSESVADGAALRIFVDRILGLRTTPVLDPSLGAKGYSKVLTSLPSVIKSLYFRGTAYGLVVVVDSNHSSLRSPGGKNRLQLLEEISGAAQPKPRGSPPRAPLRLAIGVAAPAIEAWLLCKRDLAIHEQAWEQGLASKSDPYSKQQLKKLLYGVAFPSLALETAKMTEAASELALDISHLERQFPIGFGTFAQQLRSWKSVSA